MKWNHVPGIKNPADVATRGISCDEVKKDSLWFTGPDFLYKQESCWPSLLSPKDFELNNHEEVIKEAKVTSTVNLTAIKTVIDLSDVDASRYSNFDKLLRITAYVMRFKNNILRLRNKDSSAFGDISGIKIPELSIEEIRQAKNLLIKYEQGKMKNSPKYRMWERSLGLFEDEEGFIRCRGRLGKSELEYASKFPLLLSCDSHFTVLFILLCHNNVKHMGLE